MEKTYRMKEPKNVREALSRLKKRLVPALLASLTLMLLVAMLVYFKIDSAYGLGTSAIIFTSFASSIFIMFITPNSRAARNSKFLKSYILAAITGYIGGLSLSVLPLFAVAGLVLFVLILLMVITQSEHPPAAAIAFAFVLFHIGTLGIIIIFSGVAIVIVLRYALEKGIFEVEREVYRLEEKQLLSKKKGK